MNSEEIINLNGIEIKIQDSWSNTMKYVFRQGIYEQVELQFIQNLHEKERVVELGTGIGFLSAYISKFKKGAVFTYEINDELAPSINDTLIRNQCESVFPHYYTLGKENGFLEYGLHPDFWATSSLLIKYPTRQCKVWDFKKECNEINPTTLIIDIEGGEYSLLTQNEIPPTVSKIIIEFHPAHLFSCKIDEIQGRLEEQNFKMMDKKGEVCYYGKTKEFNLLPFGFDG